MALANQRRAGAHGRQKPELNNCCFRALSSCHDLLCTASETAFSHFGDTGFLFKQSFKISQSSFKKYAVNIGVGGIGGIGGI